MDAGFSQQNRGGDARTQDLIRTVADISSALMNEVSKVIIGKNENLRRVSVGILSNGNMLLEDFPGLAKTLLANTFARALGCKFKRVQFTPDLLPSDIMGTYMYDQKSGEFKLRAGPLFSNILLGQLGVVLCGFCKASAAPRISPEVLDVETGAVSIASTAGTYHWSMYCVMTLLTWCDSFGKHSVVRVWAHNPRESAGFRAGYLYIL